jgi:Terminase large subunit, T4likevirus-type, N-terminal
MKPLVSIRRALADQQLLGGVMIGESWAIWRALLIAAMGEQLTDAERALYQSVTGRAQEPLERVEELWVVAGRRSGKTRCAALLAAYVASLIDHKDKLSPGERGLVLFLAANQKQAQIAFGYAQAVFETVSLLGSLVKNITADTISLTNGIDLEIRAASFRGLRGVTAVAVIGDEASFWRTDELSANADAEILNAVRPSLATTGGPLIVISTPYSKAGAVYETWRNHYGINGDPRILVAKGASRDFNPSLPQSVVDRAVERDAAAASAEYLGEFRGDIQAFVSREAVDACVSPHVFERAPVAGTKYTAFVDPSGGSSDSMTLAIGHRELNGTIVLDCIRERRAPFSPDAVVSDFVTTLQSYSVTAVHGDHYGGVWPRERFSKHAITYFTAEKAKSDLYLHALPLFMSGRVDLLDNQRLVGQLCGLERRTGRGGRDNVDHRSGTHDDVANSVAGLIYMLREIAEPKPVIPIFCSVPRTYIGYPGATSHLPPHLSFGPEYSGNGGAGVHRR